ncbi:MAG: hypothetical protein DWQ07_07250 [Chloroflexi bacterium]|nr:MAG: hypothetical protein DWQ07_07250 [Chloroflexota bacterium]MBL1195503.1 hypothetical protein [Chloroflexota bacterium]NOH12785.1 hypothetical protein [Chloroflexota bacterium]
MFERSQAKTLFWAGISLLGFLCAVNTFTVAQFYSRYLNMQGEALANLQTLEAPIPTMSIGQISSNPYAMDLTAVAIQFTATPDVQATKIQASEFDHVTWREREAAEFTAGRAVDWPLVRLDEFSESSGYWILGTNTLNGMQVDQWIDDGMLLWGISADYAQAYEGMPNATESFSELYLTVDISFLEGTSDHWAGIQFADTGHDFYRYLISSNGEFSIWRHSLTGADQLKEPEINFAFLTKGSNNLTVIAKGQFFYLFLNNEYIAALENGSQAAGIGGLVVEFFDDSERVVVGFDNFELRSREALDG